MSYFEAPVLFPPPPNMAPRTTTCYMILHQEDREERGRPVAMFWDPFAARTAFDSIQSCVYAFTGSGAYQLVAYELQPDGILKELQLVAQK